MNGFNRYGVIGALGLTTAFWLLAGNASAEEAKPGKDLKKAPEVAEKSIGVDSLSGEQKKAAANTEQVSGGQDVYSTKEAWQASADGIVLHYGEGFLGADIAAGGYSKRGFNCIALPGGPDGQVDVIVGKSVPLRYTQDDLDSGTVGAHAMRFYRDRIGEPVNYEESGNYKHELPALSRREAGLKSDGMKVVLHYGAGADLPARAAAELLVEDDGLDATAYPGGKPGQVEYFINRERAGKFTVGKVGLETANILAVERYQEIAAEEAKKQNKKEGKQTAK